MPNRRDDDLGSAIDQLVASAMKMGDQQGGRGGHEDLGGSIAKVVSMALKMGGLPSSGAGTKSRAKPSRAKPSHAKPSSHGRKGGRAQRFDSSDDDSSDYDSSDSESDSESETDSQDEDGYSGNGILAKSAGQRLGGDNRPRTAEVSYAPRPKTNAKFQKPQSKSASQRANEQNAASAYKPAAYHHETSRKIKIESDDDDSNNDDDDSNDDDDDDDYDSSAIPASKKTSGYKRPYIEEDGMDFAYHPASNRPKVPAASAKGTPSGKKYKSHRVNNTHDAYGKKHT